MMGVLRVLIAHIPPFIGNPLADRFGDLIYHVAPRSRRAAIRNMRQVLGRVPPAELRRRVHGVFHNVMRNYYDLCRAPGLTDAQLERATDFDDVGWSRVRELHEQGRGVLLMSAHFGSFDIITQLISRKGLPLTFLVAQFKPAWLSDFIMEMRGSRGLTLLLVDTEEPGGGVNLAALKEGMRQLRSGGILGLVADRNTEESGVCVRFFGRPAVVAQGLAKMALRTNSPIVPGFCRRLPKGRYQVTFEEPVMPKGSASNEEDVRATMQEVFNRIERQIALSPEQWVLLQPVWEKV